MSIEECVSGLIRVEGTGYPAYCSAGAQMRALKLSRIAEKGYAFLRSFIPASYEVPLLVLNEEDWRRYFNYPYGMMAGEKGCIHFPADEEPPTIDTVRPFYDNGPESLKRRLAEAVGTIGDPYREAFKVYRDAMVVHELTHVFLQRTDNLLRIVHKDEPVVFGLPWFNEFLCNYTTYAFLKRHEDEYGHHLRIVELLPEVIHRGGLPLVKHTFEDLNTLYTDVGVLNYVWFMMRNMLGAAELYDMYGEDFIRYALEAFRPSNDFLVRNLETAHGGLGAWFRDWLQENP